MQALVEIGEPAPADWTLEAVRDAVGQGLLDGSTTLLAIMDFDGLRRTVDEMKAAFPSSFVHRFAVKANGLTEVLRAMADMELGAEVASPGELALARAAGISWEAISFNSPAKTVADLRTCLGHGLTLYMDNEQEFLRVQKLRAAAPGATANIGFRINTQVGGGLIAATSTAVATSKFGYPLEDEGNRDAIARCYLEHGWLNCLQVHTGSQGVPLELMVESVARLVELAEDINRRAGRHCVTRINIGGGLPWHPDPSRKNPSFADYAQAMRQSVPALFSGRYVVETEFGRSIAARNGLVVTRVEYTKKAAGRHIAITHAGAQFAARTAFAPAAWPLHVSALNRHGERINRPRVRTDVTGPCCFAGDLVCKDYLLEELEADDFVVIHNVGAYYFSNHYDFNSLPRMAVYALRRGDGRSQFDCIRPEWQTADLA